MITDSVYERLSLLQSSLHEFERHFAHGNTAFHYCQPNDGRYPFIPLDISSFLRSILAAKEILRIRNGYEYQPKFLEIGCGVGIKLILLKCAYNAWGLEINKDYIKKARQINGKEKIVCGDALKFKNYGDYKVIYFYRPFADTVKQIELEKRIYEQ